MKKIHLHLITLSMIVLLALPLLFKIDSQASDAWYMKDGTRVISGTQIYTYLSGDTLYVCGSGEIPDYTRETLGLRPWNELEFTKVVIKSGITRVGKYAFAEKRNLQKISIPSSIFFADASCFENVHRNTLIDITGSVCAYKNINGILYDSFQSISAGAPNGANCTFVVDDDQTAWALRETYYPYLQYVYARDEDDKPWEKKEKIFEDDAFSGVASLQYGNKFHEFLLGRKRPVDENYITAFSILKGTDTYVCSYSMDMYNSGKKVFTLATPTRFVLNIPPLEQVPGRTFRLLEIAPDGTLTFLEDLDQDIRTITYETTKPSSMYALIYH